MHVYHELKNELNLTFEQVNSRCNIINLLRSVTVAHTINQMAQGYNKHNTKVFDNTHCYV